MIDLKYSLVIEATEDPNFFGFYSPDLEGFTGTGNSVEDCLYKARWGMAEHVLTLREGLACSPGVKGSEGYDSKHASGSGLARIVSQRSLRARSRIKFTQRGARNAPAL